MSSSKIIVEEESVVKVTGKLPAETFRNSSDVELFYRFVSENNLRREAKMMFEFILDKVSVSKKKKKGRGAGKNKKVQ